MLDDCYFYTRYVDDIIILFHEDPTDALSKIEALLPDGVAFNLEKCVSIHRPRTGNVRVSDGTNGISYLGYDFSYKPCGPKKPSTMVVGIAPKKIKKIKTRISLSLFDFCKNNDYELLKKRLKFISSNFKITDDNNNGNLYAGVFFNHSLIDIDRHQDLKEIDDFLQRSIFSKKGALGSKLHTKLSVVQKRELARFSLMHGHQAQIVRRFGSEDFRSIKNVWSHV